MWCLNALFFGSSIYYVKMRTARRGTTGEGQARDYRRAAIAYHGGMVVVLGVLAWLGWMSPLVMLAFVPLLGRLWAEARGTQLTIRQLGFRELGMSIGYAVGLILFL